MVEWSWSGDRGRDGHGRVGDGRVVRRDASCSRPTRRSGCAVAAVTAGGRVDDVARPSDTPWSPATTSSSRSTSTRPRPARRPPPRTCGSTAGCRRTGVWSADGRTAVTKAEIGTSC